jgi:hypothetical protein
MPSIRVGGMFMHDREAPAEWTRRLRDISPVSDILGWLELVWEPGDPWIPSERWTLYEMLHPTLVDDPMELMELYGPHPRSEGHICTAIPTHDWPVKPPGSYQPCLCRRKTESWRRGPCTIVTLTQWKLFRRTGYVGRPFWVIQGSNGGHKHSFTHEEEMFLEQAGLLTKAPGVGVLDHAPFDERVVRQITAFNRLWAMSNSIEEFKNTMGPGYERYRKTVDTELRKQLVKHLSEQMKEPTELFLRAMKKGQLDNKPRTEIDYDRLAEENEKHFVETGEILHHSRLKPVIQV